MIEWGWIQDSWGQPLSKAEMRSSPFSFKPPSAQIFPDSGLYPQNRPRFEPDALPAPIYILAGPSDHGGYSSAGLSFLAEEGLRME